MVSEIVRLMSVRYRGRDENGQVVREYFFEGSDGSRYARRWADGAEGPRFELFEDYDLSELAQRLRILLFGLWRIRKR